MQTHDDFSHEDFFKRLLERANDSVENRRSEITTGKPDERPLSSWRARGVECVHLPPDEQGILRISIGGGHPHVELNYCNFRGDLGKCISLLEKALKAMRSAP